jgi:hypothetical protein
MTAYVTILMALVWDRDTAKDMEQRAWGMEHGARGMDKVKAKAKVRVKVKVKVKVRVPISSTQIRMASATTG